MTPNPNAWREIMNSTNLLDHIRNSLAIPKDYLSDKDLSTYANECYKRSGNVATTISMIKKWLRIKELSNGQD